MGKRQSQAVTMGIAFAVFALLALALASAAGAADSVYWSNFEGSLISHANLAGGGGGDLPATLLPPAQPNGTALDPAIGTIYWTNFATNTIDVANIDGSEARVLKTSGTSIAQPTGLAVDAALGRIYWANAASNTISYANLDGSGGGDLPTTGAPVAKPLGVAVDPVNGRIYWANGENNSIAYANLDGSGGGAELNVTGAPIDNPDGLAIDTALNRVYWVNYPSPGSIGYASLDGGEGGELSSNGAALNQPAGIAIDPAAQKLYVGNNVGSEINVLSLAGGGARLDTTGATVNGGIFPALLERPVPTAAPSISGGDTLGSTLSCGGAAWAGDLVESMLYRAPQSVVYRWSKDGQPISGATKSTLTASQSGSYTCTVAADNGAGSTSQTTSALVVVATLKLTKVKLDKAKGTATLSAEVSGPGSLTLTGKGLVKRTASSAGPGLVKLTVRAKGKAKRLLAGKGKAKVTAKVSFAPRGGASISASKSIVLRRRAGVPSRR